MSGKTKKGFAARNFHDAGTEQSFKAGEPVEIEAGAYANYERAGLVVEKKPAAKATDEAAGASTGSARTAAAE